MAVIRPQEAGVRSYEGDRTLAEPQKPPRKLRRRVRCTTDLEVGQHVIYSLDSGRRVMFRVLDVHEDKGGRGPVVALLEWRDTEAVPKNPATLPVQDDTRSGRRNEGMGFLLFGSPGDPSERLDCVKQEADSRLGWLRRSGPPNTPRRVSQWVSRWHELDRWFDAEGNLRWLETSPGKGSDGG